MLDVEGEDGDVAVPSLVAEMSDARRLLSDRRGAVLEFFPEFQPTWDRFARVLDLLKCRFLKVQLEELWDLEGDDFLSRLESALRWFDTSDEDDFEQLLEIASIEGYDRAGRTFPSIGGDVTRAYHLRGYADDDSFWDNTSDL
jgi:hypothetical protein